MTSRPDDRELDDELRTHLALSIQERIADGEEPEAARSPRSVSSAICRRSASRCARSGEAIVVGVLEPSVPYPAETEIIANVVTSPHRLPGAIPLVGARRRPAGASIRLGTDIQSTPRCTPSS